jgi:hypothetical protein
MNHLRTLGAYLALVTAFGAAPAFAQQPAPPARPPAAPAAPLTPEQAHDFSGVWQLAGGTSRGFPQSEWSATPLPFTPAGRKAFDDNHPGKGPRLIPAARGNDPIGQANPPGLYRTLIYPRPFEMIQTKDKIVQAFELSRVWRAIYTDGRPVPKDVAAGPYWYGYSVGGWEGDVLVVHTLALDERAWMDEWGTPFTADAKFEERWRRTGPDRLQVTITVTDPAYYSKPWTTAPTSFVRQRKDVEPGEIIFAPIDEEAFNDSIRDPAGLPAK